MPNIDDIKYFSLPSNFLKDSEISELQQFFSDLNTDINIEEDIYNALDDKAIPGLTKEAFSIGTRAPLYEIKEHLRYSLNNIWEGLTDTNEAIMYSGNDHRQKEANKLWDEVTKEFNNNYKENLIVAVNKYNNDRIYYVNKEETQEINGETQTEVKWYPTYSISVSIESGVETTEPPATDPSDILPEKHNNHVKKINDAIKNAKHFYEEYVERARKLKEECDKLETSKPGYDPTPQDEKTQRHKRDSSGTDSNGRTVDFKTYEEIYNENTSVNNNTTLEQEIADPVTPEGYFSYEDLKELVKHGASFYLPVGYRLCYDGYLDLNKTIEATEETGPILFKPSPDGKYYCTWQGEHARNLMETNILMNGRNTVNAYTPLNDTRLYFDSNGDGKADNNYTAAKKNKKIYDKKEESIELSGGN